MSTINDLPNELIRYIALDLATHTESFFGDIAAFALTNRRFYSISNGFLYEAGAHNVVPVFWAAQNGRADTLLRLLRATPRRIRREKWCAEGITMPASSTVAKLSCRYQSMNTLSVVSHLCLRVSSVPHRTSVKIQPPVLSPLDRTCI